MNASLPATSTLTRTLSQRERELHFELHLRLLPARHWTPARALGERFKPSVAECDDWLKKFTAK
ncbi:MAG: hypothetical protein Q8K32_12635 [Archangium sp.]|nr:hypothetical protein [Archangium sp.]